MNMETIKSNFKAIWKKFHKEVEQRDKTDNQSRVMTQEEKLDEELRETFPASDPPGHFAKSEEDRNLH